MKIAYDLRAQDNAALEAIIGRMKLAAAGLEGSFGAKASCEVTEYCPGPEYDEALGELFKETVAGTFGKETLGTNCGGGGEDFHFYKKAKPELRVLYYGIGSGAAPGLHDRNMNFNEAILPQASQLLVNVVGKILA
ncbi:M20/M25/M40 family metallo-hydrolase [Parasutterella excrementihominis]|uniref:M20/M25/M40 family metallo-hydrolase n=1 Tax=Parasutterella excrementihominis TaxID=487175 RepID=UPI00242C365B|nr:M20/M25/M40 family metallo-hydrolase [Parasutterella excrementihominis]